MKAEWTAFKEGFVGTAEEICDRTSGKPTHSRKKKEQWWWNPEIGQAIQEKKEALKCVEEASEAEKTRLKQKYGKRRRTQQTRLLRRQEIRNNRNVAI